PVHRDPAPHVLSILERPCHSEPAQCVLWLITQVLPVCRNHRAFRSSHRQPDPMLSLKRHSREMQETHPRCNCLCLAVRMPSAAKVLLLWAPSFSKMRISDNSNRHRKEQSLFQIRIL